MSNQKQDPIYVPGTFGNVVRYSSGEESWLVDFTDLKALSDFVKTHKTPEGKLRLQISKQRNDPSKLSIRLNTFVPKAKQEEVEEDIF